MNEVDILCDLETKNLEKPDKAVCPVKLDEAEYPVKLWMRRSESCKAG